VHPVGSYYTNLSQYKVIKILDLFLYQIIYSNKWQIRFRSQSNDKNQL